MRHPALLGCVLLVAACGGAGAPPPDDVRAAMPPAADPGFPDGYERWTAAPAPVLDEAAGEVRELFRSPGARPGRDGRHPVGTVLVKVHEDLGDRGLVRRIDVRRRTADGPFEGWTYESYDAATHGRLTTDAETCALCHAAAPDDGTYTSFR
jgi:hypothetical protein